MKVPTRLLIIDDNSAEIVLIREVLADTNWNAEVEGLTTVAEAIERLVHLPLHDPQPDLLLMDYRLAGETAVSLLTQVRALSDHRLPPLAIFSSSELPPAHLTSCYDMGALRVFEKPATYEGAKRLIERLRALLLGNKSISSGGSWIGDANELATPEDS